jgi:hypothetical protein
MAQSKRRAYSMSSSRSGANSNGNSISNSNSNSMSGYDETGTAASTDTAAAEKQQPLFTPVTFTSTAGSVQDDAALGDCEAGIPVITLHEVQQVEPVRDFKFNHSLSEVPLSDAKVLPYSGSGDWGLRTLREESSSAYASVPAAVPAAVQ